MIFLTPRERVTLWVLGVAAVAGAGVNLYRQHHARVAVQVIHAKSASSWDRALAHARALSLNTATVEDLERLPGIGATLATRIIAWRDARGPFASVDALREIDGIGPALLARLHEYLTL